MGYSFGSNDAYGYVGAIAAMNTVYASISSNSGGSIGYTAGLSPFSGVPISSNFFTAGVNYNITHDSWSGNISAWTVDQTGWNFNPSFSAMIFPEQTTNLVRGQEFRNNDQVLSRFFDADQQKRAIEYFGFEGEYIGGEGQSYFWNNSKGEYGIRYTDQAFDSYNALYSAYMKESFHQSRYIKYGSLKKANTIEGLEIYSLMPEEREGTIYLYKKQGLFRGDSYNYLKAIRNVENIMNDCNSWGYYSPSYNFTPYKVPWYNIIYKIPRLL